MEVTIYEINESLQKLNHIGEIFQHKILKISNANAVTLPESKIWKKFNKNPFLLFAVFFSIHIYKNS